MFGGIVLYMRLRRGGTLFKEVRVMVAQCSGGRAFGACSVLVVQCSGGTPPPRPNTGLCKHGDPVFPHFWALLNHHFCGPDPIEAVVCSLVRAAGRVHMGGEVLVRL